MKFFVPKLEHLCTIKVVTSLANRHDFITSLANFRFNWSGPQEADWDAVETRIRDDVSILFLPEMLKQRAENVIKPILYEILKWREYHKKWCQLDLTPPNRICWTPQGAIDKRGTAERLIQDGNVSVIDRYHLACFYCLETHIMDLWKVLPDAYKRQVYDRSCSLNSSYKTFIFYWNCVMKEERQYVYGRGLNVSLFQKLFQEAIICCNLPAAEFCFQKLNPVERKAALSSQVVHHMLFECRTDSLCGKAHTEILYFFLSQMDKEQQKKMFVTSNFSVLLSFLVWPWQGLFLEVANCMWEYLSTDCFAMICAIFASRVYHGFKDYDYQKLFTEFWIQSPEADKQFVFSCAKLFVSILGSLFVINGNDHEVNIRQVLKDATVDNLDEIIFKCEDVINGRSAEHTCETPEKKGHWMRFNDLLKLIHMEKSGGACNTPSKNMCLEIDQKE